MQGSPIIRPLSITIFTDGSCHNQLKTGGWACIIVIDSEKLILEGSESDTTHQRMELTAVLESLRYLERKGHLNVPITVYSDSQYVVDLLKRKERLAVSGYRTKKFKTIRNADLVQKLVHFMSLPDITFHKIKSHLKTPYVESTLNREVDLLARRMMRKHN
jgi:ribonuclease HI